jgi:hypothetical protein
MTPQSPRSRPIERLAPGHGQSWIAHHLKRWSANQDRHPPPINDDDGSSDGSGSSDGGSSSSGSDGDGGDGGGWRRRRRRMAAAADGCGGWLRMAARGCR